MNNLAYNIFLFLIIDIFLKILKFNLEIKIKEDILKGMGD